jgi:hypothetical protein
MSSTLTAYGSLIAAADDRTLTYRLLPFGEPGRTNRGTVTVDAGVVAVPDDPSSVVLNVEHERTRPVAVATSIVEDPAGLVATFAVAPTTAGDDLLVEARSRLRAGVSVELDDVVIRSGRLVAGRLVGAGAVVAPAFASALLVAADTDPDPDPDVDPDVDPAPVDDPVDDPDTDDDASPAEPEEPTMTDTIAAPAAAPASLAASAVAPAPASLDDVMSRLTAANVAAFRGDRSTLDAALADVGKPTVDHAPAQWVGELWRANADRRVVPLLSSGTLTGLTVTGWRWVVDPEVDTWAGDKTAVPSNAADTEPVTVPAHRLAGAHDLPREHRDFDTGFIPSYYAAMTASYARKSDAYVASTLLAGATVIPNVNDPVGALMAGALAVGEFGSPSFALVAHDVFATLAGVKAQDAPAFLDLTLTFDGQASGAGLRVVSVPGLAAKTVLVGDRRAATVHELPGVPIRAEALDMVKGGIDAGVFGYCALVIHDARCIVKNTVAAPAAATK